MGFFGANDGGFAIPKKFIHLIMLCVTSPSYKLVVNGTSFGFFQGKRGLRLNHLLFADDLLLFCKGNEQSIMWILRSFATFSAATGLSLNKSKSKIYFNGVASPIVKYILQVSGFHRGTLPFKYLGVPISAKKLTKHEGMKLTDRIVARIRSWGTKHLSYAGMLTLFRKSEYQKPSSISWDTCCVPKEEGGLGIKDEKCWNKALLRKYAWCRLLQKALRINLSGSDLVHWVSRTRRSKFQRRYIRACYVELFYYIWRVRNEARIDHYIRAPAKSVLLM
ncbi:uncharacterized protein LOC141640983 [Silene latifolia]|uniref:uncharacterized protein LOC141640983 n=1 Tax=Silene latifolia TaxID=37657 RepID=UPI003D76D137